MTAPAEARKRCAPLHALHFASRGTMFRKTQIEGFGRPVALGTQGAALVEHEAPAGTTTIAVNYRFHLAPGMAPGTYAWPLDIVARRVPPHEIVRAAVGSFRASAPSSQFHYSSLLRYRFCEPSHKFKGEIKIS